MKENGNYDKFLIANFLSPEQLALRNSKFYGALKERPVDYIRELIGRLYARLVSCRSEVYLYDDSVCGRMDALANWLVESPKYGLMLMGSTGTGKTSLAMSLVHALHADKAGVCFTSATEIIRSFQYGENGEWVLQRYIRYRVLVIDDLGLESKKCYQYGTQYTPIEDIIRKRSDMRMITIVCTSLGQSGLKERYPVSVYDRLAFEYEHIFLGEESYRRMLSNNKNRE